MKQLPASEYPEAWQLIVQAFLQTKCGFKVPKGWERNELLAPSLTLPVVLLGGKQLSGCSGVPGGPSCPPKVLSGGLLPITALPGPELPKHERWAPTEERQLPSENPGEWWREGVCGETAPCAGRCGGKSCWKRGLGCRLMLTRLLILFLSDLVEIPRHPKDKVWKLSCKLVPLKSKQTMNPWSNYTRNFPDFSALM